jgi:hypothetical protein
MASLIVPRAIVSTIGTSTLMWESSRKVIGIIIFVVYWREHLSTRDFRQSGRKKDAFLMKDDDMIASVDGFDDPWTIS